MHLRLKYTGYMKLFNVDYSKALTTATGEVTVLFIGQAYFWKKTTTVFYKMLVLMDCTDAQTEIYFFSELKTRGSLGPGSLTWEKSYEFDRSTVSLRFNMSYVIKLTGRRTSTNKTSDIRGRAIFGCQWHKLNKLVKGSQDDATHIISRLWV